jgi:Domain of unknown function (DUF4304)
MTKEQYFAIVSQELNDVFSSWSFKGKNNFWFKKVDVSYQLIELQKSNWGPGFYLNIGLMINPEEPVKKKTPSYNWHYTSRFERIMQWDHQKHKSHFYMEDDATDSSVKVQLSAISLALQTVIFPKLDRISTKEYLLSVQHLSCIEDVWFLKKISAAELIAKIKSE